jgi:hypothetical protein
MRAGAERICSWPVIGTVDCLGGARPKRRACSMDVARLRGGGRERAVMIERTFRGLVAAAGDQRVSLRKFLSDALRASRVVVCG